MHKNTYMDSFYAKVPQKKYIFSYRNKKNTDSKRICISIYIMLYLINFPVVIIPSAKLLIPFNRLLAP